MCSSTAVGKASTLGRLNAELSTVQLHGTAVDVGPGPNKGSLGEWISVSVNVVYIVSLKRWLMIVLQCYMQAMFVKHVSSMVSSNFPKRQKVLTDIGGFHIFFTFAFSSSKVRFLWPSGRNMDVTVSQLLDVKARCVGRLENKYLYTYTAEVC